MPALYGFFARDFSVRCAPSHDAPFAAYAHLYLAVWVLLDVALWLATAVAAVLVIRQVQRTSTRVLTLVGYSFGLLVLGTWLYGSFSSIRQTCF